MANRQNDSLDHLYIPKSRFNSHKKTPKRFIPEVPKFTKEEREDISERLINGLNTVADLDTNYKDAKLPDYIFKISTNKELNLVSTKKTLEKLGFSWLKPIDAHTVAVSLGKDKRENLEKKLNNYGQTEKLHSYFDPIKTIEPISQEDKFSPRFNTIATGDQAKIRSEIDFYPNLSLEEYERSIDYIAKLIGNDNITYKKENPEIPFVRVIATKNEIKNIASGLPSVKKIEPVPGLQMTTGSGKKTEEVDFASPDQNLGTIMVIDCGVNHKHPGIKNVLIFKKSYTSNLDTEDTKEKGHGTSVAGLAAYGETLDTNQRYLTPSSKIGVAKILDDTAEDTPIEDVLERIVKDGVEKGIRIYSLTIMYAIPVTEISKTAYIIDKLSKDYNVLFVISTGNLDPNEIEQFFLQSNPYPRYLENSQTSKIFRGAEACCALTVGGIAHVESSNTIAAKFEASPFTRAGPTPDGRLKPDLVHYAGNINKQYTYTKDLGLVSLNYDTTNGIYSVMNVGTSFSTPIVANLASQILTAYPTASANLIRALLAHSSDIKEPFRNVGEPRFVYGFGFPEVSVLLKSTVYTPTLLFEGEVSADEIAEIKIPVPKEIGQVKGSKFMKITMAYDPIVSLPNAELDYSLINLKFKIMRKNKGSVYNKIGSGDRGWQMKTYRLIENNTIKKDRYQWERGHAGEDWVIRVESSLKSDKKGIPKQRFAIVVTIEDSRKETDLYTPIKQVFDMETATMHATVSQLKLKPQNVQKKR